MWRRCSPAAPKDTGDSYVYAVVLIDGATPEPWPRAAGGNGSTHTFGAVTGDIISIVAVQAKNNPAKVTCGPVITVKPKG